MTGFEPATSASKHIARKSGESYLRRGRIPYQRATYCHKHQCGDRDVKDNETLKPTSTIGEDWIGDRNTTFRDT